MNETQLRRTFHLCGKIIVIALEKRPKEKKYILFFVIKLDVLEKSNRELFKVIKIDSLGLAKTYFRENISFNLNII